ncbi:MAG: hypothetical protein GY754_12400 [bacterium]|nr:hypothetical protein [bacterium]
MEVNYYEDKNLKAGRETYAEAKSAMTYGIVGLALCEIPVVGLVLGIIALSKQAGLREQIMISNPPLPGKGQLVAAKACGIGAILGSIFSSLYYIAMISSN